MDDADKGLGNGAESGEPESLGKNGFRSNKIFIYTNY
jgi:hypothetical protein